MDPKNLISSNFPERKTVRAYFHDYSGGDYFITICTHEKKHYFGEIKNCEIYYTPIGKHTLQLIGDLEKHYPYMKVRQFVVMPNHVHAIIRVDETSSSKHLPQSRSALSVIIGGLKQSVTMYARKQGLDFAWQKNYHDRIIRHNEEMNRISQYISNNIGKWEKDCYFQQ